METGQYRYNTDSVRDLFEGIIRSLSFSTSMNDAICPILADACRHFRFCCGFVYETDYTGVLNLKERFVAPGQSVILPKSFKREKPFSLEEIGDMLRSPAFFDDFDAASRFRDVMLVPIVDDDNEIIGLVGMMDRRRGILADRQSARTARMILNLLGNGVKTRSIRKNPERARESMTSRATPT